MENNNLNHLEEVQNILKSKNAKTYFMGGKPKEKRPLIRFKMAATSVIFGLGISALGIGDFKDLNSDFFNIQKNSNQTNVIYENTNLNKIVLNELEDKSFIVENSIRTQYPLINFDNIKNTRDVSKQFLGVNNFIALAAEMEGFRGDLHKDPAVGLNIGFGYNITKRVQENKEQVIKDLAFVGFEDDMITKIIDLSQVPQQQLTRKIKEFNIENNLKDNQLITLEQGVGLLSITQEDYKNQARKAFESSFNKMGKNQQEVLTYAAYKAGYEALSKYRRAIKAADDVFGSDKEKNMQDFKKIAKELNFYYKKDGKEWVLDERASLIANTFVHQDFLAVQVGANEKIELSARKISENRIDFSHLPKNLAEKVSLNIDKLRENNQSLNVSNKVA